MRRLTKSVYEAILDQLEKETRKFTGCRGRVDSKSLLGEISSSCRSLLSVILGMSIPSAVRPQFMERLRNIYGENHGEVTVPVGEHFMATIAALTPGE